MIQPKEIPALRLRTQQVSGSVYDTPAGLLSWMGAMQAQDYNMCMWAAGLRLPGTTLTDIVSAFNRGEILRTHVLRPTWHLVAPADIRWMLQLTAPNILRAINSMDRQIGLTAKTVAKAGRIILKVLEGKNALTREELMQAVSRAGIEVGPYIAAHLMFHAEQEGLVCSGPVKGKRQTYMLLDERVPAVGAIERDDALARLALRYFSSHGPATLADFTWWSGLNAGDARKGLEYVKSGLASFNCDGKDYWFREDSLSNKAGNEAVFLLPAFDEYLVSYKDRSDVLVKDRSREVITVNGIFKPVIIVKGKVAGLWRQDGKKESVTVTCSFFGPGTRYDRRQLQNAAKRFGAFLGRRTEVQIAG